MNEYVPLNPRLGTRANEGIGSGFTTTNYILLGPTPAGTQAKAPPVAGVAAGEMGEEEAVDLIARGHEPVTDPNP